MDQKKIGQFLQNLRKEKNITQEQLAERLNVSNKTISRWETGTNMPDLSLLVELADFYNISIPEIIEGQFNLENQEPKNTAIKLIEYSKNKIKLEKKKMISNIFIAFGVFIIVCAFAIFPSQSSWGCIFSVFGGFIMIIGIYLKISNIIIKKGYRFLSIIGFSFSLFIIFHILDFIAVSYLDQVPRFSYEKISGENEIEHKTLFYTVIQKNPGTKEEKIEIKF